jgi:hypothetical protein
MPDKKISDLTSAGTLTGAEQVPIVQSGSTVKTLLSTLSNYIKSTITNFVPYTGATSDVNLGEFELKAGQIELDQSPTGTAGVAVTRWNDTIGITETTLKGGSVVIKNGVDLVARVVNKVTPNTTLTKAAYQVVKVSGAQGQRLAVGLAQANNDNNSADTIGVVTETIATNQEGFILTVGQLEGINTTGSLQSETWSDGDVLYLSPTTAGRITNIKPTGLTGHIVVIGYVEYSHINNGKIYVKIMNGLELDELHNVYINPTTLANNDVLTYDSATSLWKNKQSNSWVDITASCTIIGWLSFAINKIKSVDMGSYYIVNGQVTGTSNSSNTQVVLPFTNNGVQLDDCRFAISNGTNIFARCFVLAGSNTVDFRATAAGSLFGSLGTKAIYFTVIIEK